MQSASKCAVCGEGGHKPSRCKALAIPPEGFFTGGDGGGGHGGDDEDESLGSTSVSSSPQMTQSGSLDGEIQPTQRELASAPHNSPSTPSSERV